MYPEKPAQKIKLQTLQSGFAPPVIFQDSCQAEIQDKARLSLIFGSKEKKDGS